MIDDRFHEAHAPHAGEPGSREAEREEAIADMRRRFRRAQLAMSFLPATELTRHLGLPESGIANKLLGNPRLAQRIHWILVDQEKVPDLTALPAFGPVSLIDTPVAFENACLSIEAALALRDLGPAMPREELKGLARRFGDGRLKWLWANRDIWAPMSTAGMDAGDSEEPNGRVPETARRRAPDSVRLLVSHLSRKVPEIAAWMGRDAEPPHRQPRGSDDARLVERLVDRLVQDAGDAGNVH